MKKFINVRLTIKQIKRWLLIMYEEIKSRLRGSISPIVTPFDNNLDVDVEALKNLINWSVESGSHGISICGTTGEPSSLSIEERELVMETAIKTVNGRVPVAPGTGSANQKETLHLTKRAQEMGADAALVIVPYYNRPNQQALYNHFKTVADSVDIPIIRVDGNQTIERNVQTIKALLI